MKNGVYLTSGHGCLYCQAFVNNENTIAQGVCDNCHSNLTICECCYNLFMPCQTVEYGLLSTRRCANCLEYSYYACICCGLFYMDTHLGDFSGKYNKCPRCEKSFNDILDKKTSPKMINSRFSIQVWYESKHWRSGYVFKTDIMSRRYILLLGVVITETRKIKHHSNISPINIYQLDALGCVLHEGCIVTHKINYYKPVSNKRTNKH